MGYGDLSGSNSCEKFVSNAIMVLGVILFSLISTAITTIIENYDNINIDEELQKNNKLQLYQNIILPNENIKN